MEVKLNTELNEKGLFATKQYKKGDTVISLLGLELSYPTRETIYIGNNIHIHDQYGMYMNHSFTPSTYINQSTKGVIAIRDINIGDELNFDYNKNEINMAAPFFANGILVNGTLEKS